MLWWKMFEWLCWTTIHLFSIFHHPFDPMAPFKLTGTTIGGMRITRCMPFACGLRLQKLRGRAILKFLRWQKSWECHIMSLAHAAHADLSSKFQGLKQEELGLETDEDRPKDPEGFFWRESSPQEGPGALHPNWQGIQSQVPSSQPQLDNPTQITFGITFGIHHIQIHMNNYTWIHICI